MALQPKKQISKIQIESLKYALETTVKEEKLNVSLRDKETKALFRSSFTSQQLVSCGFTSTQAENLETIHRFIKLAKAEENGLSLNVSVVDGNMGPDGGYAPYQYGQVMIQKEDSFFGHVRYTLKLDRVLLSPTEINTECIKDMNDDIVLLKEQISSLTTDLSAAKSSANEETEALRSAIIDLSTQDKVSLDQQIKELKEEIAYLRQYQMPKGSVIRWYGNRMNIPEGFRVYDHENEEKKEEKEDEEVKNIFKYESDFDQNGIVYAVGSNYGASEWLNPATTGLVEIQTATNMGRVSKAKEYLLNRNAGIDCYINEMEHSWFIIDFKDIMIKPTNYTMRHITGPNNRNHLRNWELQGSNDGENWDSIHVHENDISLNENDATFTWNLEEKEKFYQYFRVKMTGTDSSDRWFLCCSGFEIYGEIVKSKSMMTLIKIV